MMLVGELEDLKRMSGEIPEVVKEHRRSIRFRNDITKSMLK